MFIYLSIFDLQTQNMNSEKQGIKVLHIAPSSEGYEEVILLANRVNRTNHLSVIEKENGKVYFTGGFIITNTPEIRKVLDSIPKDQQYQFVKDFKVDPFATFYLDEN